PQQIPLNPGVDSRVLDFRGSGSTKLDPRSCSDDSLDSHGSVSGSPGTVTAPISFVVNKVGVQASFTASTGRTTGFFSAAAKILSSVSPSGRDSSWVIV